MSGAGSSLRLRRLSVQRFRGVRGPAELTLVDGLNLLVGDNGTGKSSLCNAIEWCLFGREVEAKNSGIAEYKNREIRHRGDDDEDTRVGLVFESTQGELHVQRSRPADASPGKPHDRFTVEPPTGDRLDGDAAAEWLAAQGFPSWSDWRAAHCQHQEDVRHLLLDDNRLKVSLATLLGLEELATLRVRLDGLKTSRYVKQVKRVEAQQDAELLDLARAPGPVDEASAACEALGLDPRRISREETRAAAGALLTAAQDLVAELGLNAALPDDFDTPEDALAWARAWPAEARRLPGRHDRLGDLRQHVGALDAQVAALTPLQDQAAEADEQWKELLAAGGDAAQRKRALVEAREAAQRANDARKDAGRLRALLTDAAELLPPDDRCPVCDSTVPDLADHLQTQLTGLQDRLSEELDAACDRTAADLVEAEARVAALRRAELRRQDTAARLAERTEALRAQLGETGRDVTDPLAAARAALEALRAEAADLEPLLQTRDTGLEAHRKATEALAARLGYLDALERQSERVDVVSLDAWQGYEDALDQLVALVTDCDALATAAQALLGRRSVEQLEVVNRTLGERFAAITGSAGAAARALRLQTHATATRLTFRVEGSDGELLLPVLNQAAWNALALAVLLAQAEDRAQRGHPALLVLDDPAQSLDASHLAGLARVLEQATAFAPVVLTATPGPLVERVQDYAACPKQLVRLAPWDPARGATWLQEDGP